MVIGANLAVGPTAPKRVEAESVQDLGRATTLLQNLVARSAGRIKKDTKLKLKTAKQKNVHVSLLNYHKTIYTSIFKIEQPIYSKFQISLNLYPLYF